MNSYMTCIVRCLINEVNPTWILGSMMSQALSSRSNSSINSSMWINSSTTKYNMFTCILSRASLTSYKVLNSLGKQTVELYSELTISSFSISNLKWCLQILFKLSNVNKEWKLSNFTCVILEQHCKPTQQYNCRN